MFASSILTSNIPPEKEMVSNQASCFGKALTGCSIITINVLLEVIGKTAGFQIPEFHRVSDSFTPGVITSVRVDEAGATICEEVTSERPGTLLETKPMYVPESTRRIPVPITEREFSQKTTSSTPSIEIATTLEITDHHHTRRHKTDAEVTDYRRTRRYRTVSEVTDLHHTRTHRPSAEAIFSPTEYLSERTMPTVTIPENTRRLQILTRMLAPYTQTPFARIPDVELMAAVLGSSSTSASTIPRTKKFVIADMLFPSATTDIRSVDTILKTTKPLPSKRFSEETTEEEFIETVTELTSSPQCSEEEVTAWIEKAKSCSARRLFSSAEKCLLMDSSGLFGNVSLCVSDMEPLIAQCGLEHIYVFESIMEHLQKMIQQLKAKATQNCEKTNFCLPEKPQLVKCTGPFYDHMKEMQDTGKNYEESLNLRSMKDVDQCLAAEMKNCAPKERKKFQEIVFITYGAQTAESLKQVNVTESTSSPQCSEEEVKTWMETAKTCSSLRLFQLYKAFADKCLAIDSSGLFGNVSLCVSEMEPLMAQCVRERSYLFESIMEQLQKMIKQLELEATEKCEKTSFCLSEKPELVKCTPPFRDHIKEMQDSGRSYEKSIDSRSMKDVDQCLAEEMPKCAPEQRRTFKEIVFTTYGVQIQESSKQVNANGQYCYTYIPQQPPEGTQVTNFSTNRECTKDDADRWLNRIRKCADRRIAELSQKTFKLKDLTSKKLLLYVKLCIHVHRVLPCKPSAIEVFEPLFKALLSNSKQDLIKLVENLKSKTPNVSDAVECIQELDNENMQNCIPALFKDMNYMYSSPSTSMEGLESERCVANALTKCKDKTLKEVDYVLKSAMGIIHPSEIPQPEKAEPTNICRPMKALDIGYRACASNDLHTELQSISSCLENSIPNKPPNSVTLESGILAAQECLKKYMVRTCYIADAKHLSRMVQYTFVMMTNLMKKYLSGIDSKCLQLISESNISKCVASSYSYINSLRKGEVVGAMSLANEVTECMRQALKGCSQTVSSQMTGMLGTMGRVRYVTVISTSPGWTRVVKGERIGRDVDSEPREYDSSVILQNDPPEEPWETTLRETEFEEEIENSVVRRVREVVDDSDTTFGTSPDDIPRDETTKEEENADEHTTIQRQNENDSVTKTDLLTLEQCNASSFSTWLNKYHECFVSSKYKDSGSDLNNIIRRILRNVQECMKHSVDKRCFPSWIQLGEFLSEVVFQAKDYAEMYLSEIRQGREDIVDIPCIENLSLEWYKNCTLNIFKFLDNLRNHLVSSDGFARHVRNTAECLRYNYEDCSKMVSTNLIEVVEALLDLRYGTLGNQTVMIHDKNENIPRERKSIGEKIIDFFKSAAETIAKPFIWLYNKIKSLFSW